MAAKPVIDLTAKAILKAGNTAVITGASSGIGRATALYCSSIGMNAWMIDIDEEELKLAQELVKGKAKDAKSQKIEMRKVDVSDYEAMSKLAAEVFDGDGKCNFLMNNAGIGRGGGALEDIKVYHKTINVNTFGPINGCQAFIPKMKESKEAGLIINTGSKQGITMPPGNLVYNVSGITMPPGNLVYNVSKAALKAYTEGLEFELMKERKEKEGKLKAALLVPGWVNTSIMLKNERLKAKEAGNEEKFDPSSVYFSEDKPAKGAWMPSQVVDYMVEKLNDNKFYIICPDNDVTREIDNLKMTWTMQDLIEDRPPLSRWNPDYKDKYEKFMADNKPKTEEATADKDKK
eukprot:CAMPEP_0201592406 /NCGR_PEP_ID=MMETSP0190_2-20130828/190316_1 /ASSEMBLY_ACC=CAM_ASM_000263 /TAXON_ID=37353 /ORGANISM="Rosalina sp." /LENGTH=346 /DNA_ID=CAMNT_0048051173 /DNA_START=31 /DNA_END=1071 /DNA_ORIENTATION=-